MKISSIIKAVAAIVAMCATFNVSAQQKIENLMQQVSSNKDIKVTYSEQRDPSTREIVKSSYFLSSNDPTLFKSFMEAFQAERPNSIKYSEIDGSVFSITFLLDKNVKQSYSLVKEGRDNSWNFSTNRNGPSTSGRR